MWEGGGEVHIGGALTIRSLCQSQYIFPKYCFAFWLSSPLSWTREWHCTSHSALTLLNRDLFQITSDDVVFLASPYTFDPFIVQMFVAFAAGARIVLVPDSVKVMPSKLCHILFDQERVTILQVSLEFIWQLAKQFCFQDMSIMLSRPFFLVTC